MPGRAAATSSCRCWTSPSAGGSSGRCDRARRRSRPMLGGAIDCVIAMDSEGRVVEFNPAAERAFGYERAETIGRPVSELIVPPAARAAHDEGLRRFVDGAHAGDAHRPARRDERDAQGRQRVPDRADRDLRRLRGRAAVHRLRARHHRAPRERAGDRPPRLPRPAHRAAEPGPARGAPRSRARTSRARGARARAALPRPRQLQARERQPRPRRRRPALEDGGGAAVEDHARARTCSPATAATSCSCS